MPESIFNKNNNFYENPKGLIVQSIVTNFVLLPYYKLFFGLEIFGRNNVPEDRAVIVAATHSSYHDPPVLASALKKHVAYMAKKELFQVPVLASLITELGAFPVNRQKLEISTIKTAKRILKSEKWNLGIFPQGTRVMDGTLGDVKAGFGHLAKATKSTVIPVHIETKRGRFPFYGKITIKVGNALPDSNNVDEICENWKKAVSELMGKEYVNTELSGKKENIVL